MISAFGVDHGGYEEIEKLSIGGFGAGLGRMTQQAGQGLARGGAKAMRGARPGTGGRMNTPGKASPMQSRIGQMGVKAGGSLRRLGAGMQRNAGATGGLALGTGAVGAGGTGAALLNRRR